MSALALTTPALTATPVCGFDLARDTREARCYGSLAASQPEWLGVPWEEVAPLLANGWASRHAALCTERHDWRLSFPSVREGWLAAGGATRSARPAAEPTRPTRRSHAILTMRWTSRERPGARLNGTGSRHSRSVTGGRVLIRRDPRGTVVRAEAGPPARWRV